MTGRLGRAWQVVLAALAVACLGVCAVPAAASAAQSLAVTSPTGFPAGGDPTYSTTIDLDTSAGAPGKMTIALMPGALASVAANPSCVKGSPQYTSACLIGTGSAKVLGGLPASLNAYLVPPSSSSDLVGIDLVPQPNSGLIPITSIGGRLVQTASGNVQTVLTTDLSKLGSTASLLTQMSLTINGTLNGKPFTRMPTNCSPGATSLTIAYASKTETTAASPDFKPTGCASLPFSPTVSGSAVEDANDQGVAVTTTVTQASNEAASASTQLDLPWPTLAPNFAALSLQNSATAVGRATTVSPLLPTALQGNAYLTGTPTAPTMTLRFPPPAALTLVGKIDLAQHTVTFPTIPDVPVTRLTVSLFGGPKSLLTGACATPSGTVGGAFMGQNGASASAKSPLTLTGCSSQSGSGGNGSGGNGSGGGEPSGKRGPVNISAVAVSGLKSGHPVIRFTLHRGSNAPKLKSFTVTLPRGLAFMRRRLRAGIHVSPAHTLTLRGGRLTITLKNALSGITIRLAPPALIETTRAIRRARHVTVRLTVVASDGKASRITFAR